MVIDEHFGFIFFSWGAGLVAFVGLGLWLWRDRRALNRQIEELEGRGHDFGQLK